MCDTSEKICIGFIGLGLIGGSIAKTLRKVHPEYKLMAYCRTKATIEEAIQEGVIDIALEERDDRFADCDYIFLCAPVSTNISYLPFVKGIAKPGCIITDVGSVKGEIHQAVETLGMTHQFIGGHPMAGKERWGYQNATGTLFRGASMILTPIFTDSWALDIVQKLCQEIGFGRIVFTDPESHDKMIGYTSQLAHILSSAYIKNPLCMNYKGYTGGSFQDLTRVARLNPVMWSELFLLNRQNLLDDLDILISSLQEYRHAIAENDGQRLTQLLADGSRIKEELNEEQEKR